MAGILPGWAQVNWQILPLLAATCSPLLKAIMHMRMYDCDAYREGGGERESVLQWKWGVVQVFLGKGFR